MLILNMHPHKITFSMYATKDLKAKPVTLSLFCSVDFRLLDSLTKD